MHPRGRWGASARTWASARRHLPPLPSPSLPSPPPSPSLPSAVRADAEIFIFIFILFVLFFYLKKKIGSCCRLGKREKNSNIQFPVFNPQNPPTPRALRASRAKPREEEGFFGLVPLVTHPSSIPLLGGLTPKFLSLSFHSLQGLLMLMASRVGTLWSLGNLIDLEFNLCSIDSNEGVTTNIIIIAP
jgi:hypothetical protein